MKVESGKLKVGRIRFFRRGRRPRLPGGGRLPSERGEGEYEPGTRAVREARPYERRWGGTVLEGCGGEPEPCRERIYPFRKDLSVPQGFIRSASGCVMRNA